MAFKRSGVRTSLPPPVYRTQHQHVELRYGVESERSESFRTGQEFEPPYLHQSTERSIIMLSSDTELNQSGPKAFGQVRSSDLLTSTSPTKAAYFVYILQSLKTSRFYVGHCDHLLERFAEHSCGYSKATRGRGPWWMPYYETFGSRPKAQTREYEIKRKKSAKYIRWLISSRFPDLKV